MAHIKPTNDLAPRALLVGDPGRALALAQLLLEAPLMFNHHRGLWGYTGAAADGEPLTVQATGIGGPSAAAVLAELCDLGLEVAVRAGTCRAVDATLAAGELLVVREAVCDDGASRALGAPERVAGDPVLTAALRAAAGRDGVVQSADLYTGDAAPGVHARDLSTAAILQLARVRGIRAAAVLQVVGEDDVDPAPLGHAAAGVLVGV
jgi:uridine phosphorylase